MQQCKNCGVNVNGYKRCCPLCQGELVGSPEPLLEAFPRPPAPKYDRGLLRKLLNFTALAALAICLVVEFAFTRGAVWIFFAIGGILSGWIAISAAIRFRTRIFKNLTCQLLLVTILCLIWDRFTGNHGWAVNYVLPICCEITLVADFVLAKILKAEEQEYLIHLIVVTAYSLIPFICLIFGWATVEFPSVITSVTAFLVIAGLIVFRTRTFLTELSRRMHI